MNVGCMSLMGRLSCIINTMAAGSWRRHGISTHSVDLFLPGKFQSQHQKELIFNHLWCMSTLKKKMFVKLTNFQQLLSSTWLTLNICDQGPFYYHRLTFIPTWISNYTHYNVRDKITYLFANLNGCTVEFLEWISNFIPHFTGYVITYPCWD